MGNAEGMVTGVGGRASIDAATQRGCLETPLTPTAVPSDFPIGTNGRQTPPPGRPKAGSASNRSGHSPRTAITPFRGKGGGGKANHAA